jgi:hypothetical protein
VERGGLPAGLLVLALACAAWSVVAAIRITAALDRMGVRTPPPLIGALLFRNVRRYHEITRHETGRVGPLFYAYVVPANAAWILGAAAFAIRALRA